MKRSINSASRYSPLSPAFCITTFMNVPYGIINTYYVALLYYCKIPPLIDVDSSRNPCKVAAGNLVTKPYINWAVKRVTRCLQVLWPRSRTNLFGSNATGLALPTSDVDLVVSLPPVRNLVSCMTINDFQHGSSNAVVFLLS
jgi:hypothetical protein